MKSFSTVSRVATEQESELLLYLAQHFANAGNVQKIFNTFYIIFVLLQYFYTNLYINVILDKLIWLCFDELLQ